MHKLLPSLPKETEIVTPEMVVSVELFLTKGDVVQISVETPIQDWALACWFSLTPEGKPCHKPPFNEYVIPISNLAPVIIKPRALPYDIPYGKVYCNIRNRTGDVTDTEIIVYKETQ